MQMLRTLSIICLLVVLAGCQSTDADNLQDKNLSEPTLNDIKALIGEPQATQSDSCRLLAVGKKSCGGPQQYIVYSSESVVDEMALIKMVRRYNQQAAESVRGGVSNCQFVAKPDVVLHGGICRIKR